MVQPVWARVAIVLLLACPSIAADPSESVAESVAIRLFLEESPRARTIPLIRESVEAGWRREARLSNPAVGYQIEDSAGVRDEFLTFQQELPLTGRRRLVRETAVAASSAAALAAEGDLLAATRAVRASFYEVLYRDSAAGLLRQGTQRLARIVEILAAREREGEGAGYDLLRAEQELTELRIAAAEADVALAVARARFGSFFDPSRSMESARLEGDLEPAGEVPNPERAIEVALSRRVDLQALRAETHRLELETKAAGRRRFPEPSLTAGWKRTETPGLEDTGFVAALTVPLPLFDRGRLTVVRASADRDRAVLEAEILRREIRADVLAALARERAAREAARRHAATAEPRAGELRRIAELAYEEGEAGILELLDAHRASLATELRALALRYDARRAELDRERAIGAEVTS